MSETFHHWGTAESSWWIFVWSTLDAVVWSKDEHLWEAHRTMKKMSLPPLIFELGRMTVIVKLQVSLSSKVKIGADGGVGEVSSGRV